MSERDVMEYDVIAVGAGPAGLAFAIRLKQLKPELSVCVIEKSSTIGAHILSGAVIEPGPLDELLPGWRDNPPPICVPAKQDEFWVLSKTGGWKFPIVPPQMNNHGNFIVSLGRCARGWRRRPRRWAWRSTRASRPPTCLQRRGGAVIGVRIGDMGVAKDGSHKPGYTQGIDIHAKLTVLAEGARGHLTKRALRQFKLTEGHGEQNYSIGIKELWQVPAGRATPGKIVHHMGWPAIRRPTAAASCTTWTATASRWATSVAWTTAIRSTSPTKPSSNGRTTRTSSRCSRAATSCRPGARAIVTGGYQALPTVEMPGAMLIGDTAGLLNVPEDQGHAPGDAQRHARAEHIAATGRPRAGTRSCAARR
jgi:electron-transferring-flavoprotein dehydrogenase